MSRKSIDRLIIATNIFLNSMFTDQVDEAFFKMQHAARLEKIDRQIRYDLCLHMYPLGYCVTCKEDCGPYEWFKALCQ